MERKINYLARDYESIKNELIELSSKYYPELTSNFNDGSVGSWFIDLVSAVGDDLNYYIDRCYQENNSDSANLKSSLLNLAKNNNIKLPTAKASMCEVKISCVLPINSTLNEPDWGCAPIIKQGSIVGNSDYEFEISEDVDFSNQFNSNAVSNRTFIPLRNSNGILTGYSVTKTVLVYGGNTKIYKKVLSENDIEPFMEILLPEKGIMSVDSVLFKETATFKYNPKNYEFFVDEEQFMVSNESVQTFRYFEVDSLSEQFRFGTETKYTPDNKVDSADNLVYEDFGGYSGNTLARFFKGVWKPITQKYIVEHTDKGFTKLIFGNATALKTDYEDDANFSSYGKHVASKIINNDMLGILPKAGWTMYVMYKTNGGNGSNLAQGSINKAINLNVTFKNEEILNKSTIIRSIAVTNTTPSIGGKDEPTIDEMRYLVKYATHAQNRCVTIKDYKSRVMMIPPKYGCPFRCNVIERNNKIVIPTLYIKGNGKLDYRLPKPLADNLVEYLSHYKQLTDYVEIRSGKVYNLMFELDLFIDKNYTSSDVIKSVINKIYSYFDINQHDMGEDIFVGDLEKEICMMDGVISIIELRVYNVYSTSQNSDTYSKFLSPLPKYVEYSNSCEPINAKLVIDEDNGINAFRIGLKELDGVLINDCDSMFEILNPNTDIKVRCKLK